MGVRIGTACRWMRLRSLFCWWTACAGIVRKSWATSSVGGLWFVAQRASWSATGQSRSKIAGKKMLGYSPFTLVVEISGLLAAAEIADAVGEKALAEYLRETADNWNENVERWTYATNTALARQVGVEGYDVRIAPPETDCAPSPADGFVPIKNRPPGQSSEPATS